MKASRKSTAKTSMGNFRFRELKDKYIITNDTGAHLFLDRKTFEQFTAGNLDATHDMFKELMALGAIREGAPTENEVDAF
jgi:hypothetical protein